MLETGLTLLVALLLNMNAGKNLDDKRDLPKDGIEQTNPGDPDPDSDDDDVDIIIAR